MRLGQSVFLALGTISLTVSALFSGCAKLPEVPVNVLRPAEYFSDYPGDETLELQLSGPWEPVSLPLNWDYLYEMESFTISTGRIWLDTITSVEVELIFTGFPGRVSKDGRLVIDPRHAVGTVRFDYGIFDMLYVCPEPSDFRFSGSLVSNDDRTALTGSLTICATNASGKSFKVNVPGLEIYNVVN